MLTAVGDKITTGDAILLARAPNLQATETRSRRSMTY